MREMSLGAEEFEQLTRLNCIVKVPSLREGAELERTSRNMWGRIVVFIMSSLMSCRHGILKSFEGVISGNLKSACIGPPERPLSKKKYLSICAVDYEHCWPTPVVQE